MFKQTVFSTVSCLQNAVLARSSQMQKLRGTSELLVKIVNFLFILMISAACIGTSSAQARDADYISMSVRVQSGIVERGFRRTKPGNDILKFFGLWVDNDEVNQRVINLFQEPSAVSFCKYFASDEFHSFAKQKLGSCPQIFCSTDLSSRNFSFPPNSVIVTPKDTILALRIADSNGIVSKVQAINGINRIRNRATNRDSVLSYLVLCVDSIRHSDSLV